MLAHLISSCRLRRFVASSNLLTSVSTLIGYRHMLRVFFCLIVATFFLAAPGFAQGTGANSGIINSPSSQTGRGAISMAGASIYQGYTTQQYIPSLQKTYLGGGSAAGTLAPIFGTGGGSMAGTSSGPGGPGWNSCAGPSGSCAGSCGGCCGGCSMFGMINPTGCMGCGACSMFGSGAGCSGGGGGAGCSAGSSGGGGGAGGGGCSGGCGGGSGCGGYGQ